MQNLQCFWLFLFCLPRETTEKARHRSRTTRYRLHQLGGRGQPPTRVNAVGATDLAPVEITWQIAVGALAGIAPFVVAGIEFSKRIIAQRTCGVCGGSGLVLLKDKSYVRCPGCGGFLPWQSWKRFFTG
ncbi:hypothetical protein OPV22_000291 [Ensete ventricosum]|uniref:Viral late gene transcription factor 3 zinc ribbon domain-containing protein n=1 Tax=Ensete ventricosum TaxID=4639 RepID=A0AAV8RV81_ENSVE|nr:hypothetical protein OPV22_000291 [Ensete ventricosum]